MNVTLIVQLDPADSVVVPRGQLFVCEKSPGLVPVMPIPEIVNGAVPEFVRVTDLGALVVPTLTLPKLRFVAERLTAGAVPVPERLAA